MSGTTRQDVMQIMVGRYSITKPLLLIIGKKNAKVFERAVEVHANTSSNIYFTNTAFQMM